MRYINAYYKFLHTKIEDNPKAYRLQRLEKWGNHKIFNNIFEYHESMKVSHYDTPSIDNYLLYTVEGQVDRTKSIKVLFEMSPFSSPYGIIRSEKLEEVVLFQQNSETTEVYIIDKHISNVMNCFQLLIDGYLQEDIDEIYEIIDYEGQ